MEGMIQGKHLGNDGGDQAATHSDLCRGKVQLSKYNRKDGLYQIMRSE